MSDIYISNKGIKPPLINTIGEEVIDLTAYIHFISNRIFNGHISNETSMSDHRQILFDVA